MKRRASGRIMGSSSTQRALLEGMEQVARLVRPTLGPIGGTVAIAGPSAELQPEILTDAAIIARRLIQIDDPFADMGVMLIRQMMWQVHERVGDGSAMAAVLCTEMLRAANTQVSSGHSPTDLRRGVDKGIQAVNAHVMREARPIRRPSELAAIANSALHDHKLADMVGEVVEAVGADGVIRIEDTSAASTTYDYVQGSRWESGSLSFALMPAGVPEVLMKDPVVYVTDGKVDLQAVVPVLEYCIATSASSLLVVAPALTDTAVGVLVRNREAGALQHVMAVGVPGHGGRQLGVLEDISRITGARCVVREIGDPHGDQLQHHLGRARQAWVTRNHFGLLGGGGDIGLVRQRAEEVRQRLREISRDDVERQQLQARLATLVGASAIVRVGAATRLEQRSLRNRVEAAVRTAQVVYRNGAVPGAGTSLVGAASDLVQLSNELPASEAAGVRVLIGVLAEPLRCILVNASVEPEPVLNHVREHGDARVFDVRARQWADPWSSGILDSVSVLITALSASTSAAMTALSTDLLVRRTSPPISVSP